MGKDQDGGAPIIDVDVVKLERLEMMEDCLAREFMRAQGNVTMNGGDRMITHQKIMCELAYAYCEVSDRRQKMLRQNVMNR